MTKAIRAAVDVTGLSRPAALVLRELALHAKKASGQPEWPIRDGLLQKRTGYKRTAIKAARRELLEAGRISIVRPGHGSQQTIYRLGPAEAVETLPVAVGAEAISDPGRVDPRPGEGRSATLLHARAAVFQKTGPSEDENPPPRAVPAAGSSKPSTKPPGTWGACKHHRKRPGRNCRACGTSRWAIEKRQRQEAIDRDRERDVGVLNRLHDPAVRCPHGDWRGSAACALCRRGVPAEDC